MRLWSVLEHSQLANRNIGARYELMHRDSDGGVAEVTHGHEQGLAQVIAEFGLTNLLNQEYPVDLVEVAKALGATTVAEANIPAAGMLIPEDGAFKILVNREHDITRKRFSCAHELAHMLLSTEHNIAMRRPPVPAGNDIERKCEALAALLLMPDPAFSRLAHSEKPGIRTIAKLAQVFLTSIQATALRFVDVIKEPCVLIVSEIKDDQLSIGLRVRWSYQNTIRPGGKSLYFIPRGGTLRMVTAANASQTGRIEAETEDISVGGLRTRAYTESKSFGFRRYRYVLTLIFPNGEPSRLLKKSLVVEGTDIPSVIPP